GAPPNQVPLIGLLPELRNERAEQKLLRQAHACVGRHLEGAQLQQPQSPAAAVRRVEFVDAELGAVRVAGGVNEQVAEESVREPGRAARALGHLPESDAKFVERIISRLVNARALAGWADE